MVGGIYWVGCAVVKYVDGIANLRLKSQGTSDLRGKCLFNVTIEFKYLLL